MSSAPHTPDPETNSQLSTEIDWLSDTDLSALHDLEFSDSNLETMQQSIEEPHFEIESTIEETQETSPDDIQQTRSASPRISDGVASIPLGSTLSQPSEPSVQISPGADSGRSEGKSKPLAELEQKTEV